MGDLRDENGIKRGAIEQEGSKVVVRDEYGNLKNIAEQSNYSSDYVIRDRWGIKRGTAEKQFLSDERTIKDLDGKAKGTIETSFFSNKTKIVKDKTGREIGRYQTTTDNSGISGAAVLVIMVIGVFIYFTKDSIPMHLSNMFIAGSLEFAFLTIPLIVEIALFFIGLFRGWFGNRKENALLILFMLGYLGVIAWIILGAVIIAITFIMDGESNFFEWLIACIAMPIMYVSTFAVILLPMMVIGTILIKTVSKQ